MKDPVLLIHPGSHESLGDNINGPSLIKVPEWVENPLGRYYLYFAHHQGSSIRLAFADEILGPYQVYAPGTLQLENSGFPSAKLKIEEVTKRGILDWVEKYDVETVLPFFPPHIASPDVHVDHDRHEIWMYYHGQVENGDQLTRLAKSRDGINFDTAGGFLGQSYFRVFQHGGQFFAMSHSGGTINQSNDGEEFTAGPEIGDPEMRHTAVRRVDDDTFEVYWSRSGDEPEHILVSDLDVSGDWQSWKIENTRTVRKPQQDWEGADLEIKPSLVGFARGEVHELRDPGIYEENNRTFLLYSVRGESGIAIVEL